MNRMKKLLISIIVICLFLSLTQDILQASDLEDNPDNEPFLTVEWCEKDCYKIILRKNDLPHISSQELAHLILFGLFLNDIYAGFPQGDLSETIELLKNKLISQYLLENYCVKEKIE